MNAYKTIVLQKGLEDVAVDDYQFRKIKSLLRKKLKLTKKMQDDYDRIQMADVMEDRFHEDAGLGMLIKVCETIKELKNLARRLKTERAKVIKQNKEKNKAAGRQRKQDGGASSSQPPSTSNESNTKEPSSKKRRKQTINTEGGKKRKLTQEQTQLPEPSGSNPQKDGCCLQTLQKPPPTPSSRSSNKQKNTSIKKHGTMKTQGSQKKKKHQLSEFSATSNFSPESELPNLPGVLAAACNNLQTPQRPLETCFTLKMSPGSPAPPCQNFSVSPASDSSIHLNSLMPLTQSSGVQAPHVPSATASGNVCVPYTLSETVSSSVSTPQMSPVSVSSSAKNIHLPTAAAANSKQSPHSRPAQTSKGPSSTLKSKAKVRMMPPATASSNIQVPNAVPGAMLRNDNTTQVSERATSSDIQTLNSATVKAPRIANIPGHLETGSACFLASLASPGTSPSSLQASQVLLPKTSNSLPAPQVPKAIGTHRVQTIQTHPGTGSICIQAFHPSVKTESRNVCTTQGPQGVASSTGQALPCSEVKAPKSVHALQMPLTSASKSLLAPGVSQTTASNSLLDPLVSPATAFSASQAPLVPPATASRTTLKRNLPKEPSKVEGHHRDPKEVMVLKVTESFTYDLINDKRMFHATVATETEFFRVKVFDTALKNKFIPQKIITISNYNGVDGFLEIYGASCVSDVNVNRTIVIPNTLRQRANGTPKIQDIFTKGKGTYVNGEFAVTEKNEWDDFICYGIEDKTGKMEVVVYGRLTSIKCEPGNKLRLVCFELTSSGDKWQLKSVKHSYMQVINARRKVI